MVPNTLDLGSHTSVSGRAWAEPSFSIKPSVISDHSDGYGFPISLYSSLDLEIKSHSPLYHQLSTIPATL